MRSSCLLVVLMCGIYGCGSADTGPERFQVSGTVNFNGQPVPAGTIYFETMDGPAGSAQISNGAYDTRDGKGVVGGPHVAVIQGFDGTGTNPGEMGKPLFNPQRIDVDLPKEDTTKDFDIPASAAEGLVIPNDPA
jgi:hypothetical protein